MMLQIPDRRLDAATSTTTQSANNSRQHAAHAAHMHDVEHHTVCYLRDLLVTPAHNDPDMTTFLTFWAFEEFWHGEALGKVLAAHGEPSGRVRVAAVRARHRVKQVFAPMGTMLTSSLTNNFTAVHMSGAGVEEGTQGATRDLSTKADHPVLGALDR